MIIVKLKAVPIKKIPIWDYPDFQDKLSAGVLSKSVQSPTIDRLFAYGVAHYDLTEDVIAEHLEHFLFDINRRLKRLT